MPKNWGKKTQVKTSKIEEIMQITQIKLIYANFMFICNCIRVNENLDNIYGEMTHLGCNFHKIYGIYDVFAYISECDFNAFLKRGT